MAITPLPALDRTSPTFKTDTDTFFGAQIPTFSVETEAARVEINTNTLAAQGAATTATQKAEATALDAIATAADRVITTQDRAVTTADRAQTQLDATATAADRVKTGQDRLAVEEALAEIDGGPVASVNGDTGPAVVLGAADVGAIAATGGVAAGLKHTSFALGNISGATSINLAAAGEFTATVTGDTSMSFTNPPASGQTQVVMLKLTNAGAFALDWPAGTKFDNSTKEPLTAAGVDELGLKFDAAGVCTVYVIGLNVGVPV